MKKTVFIFFAFLLTIQLGAQDNPYSLSYQGLHKDVREVTGVFYFLDSKSGEFAKKSFNRSIYNDLGLVVKSQTYSKSSYRKTDTITSVYNYNAANKLISIINVSKKKSKYGSDLYLMYDEKGYLIRTEARFFDGRIFYNTYKNDAEGRMIEKLDYNDRKKLTAKTTVSYNGNAKKEVRTTYDRRNGNVRATIRSNFINNKRQNRSSSGKFSGSTTTYSYDKNGNLKESITTGKRNATTKNYYAYDDLSNWIKWISISDRSEQISFRKIVFKDGSTAGGLNFDPVFAKKYSNQKEIKVLPSASN
tara:strand:+ start:72685 stop:73596 length:912 start_codon:yes stop_codon:yes gene_type:complete